MSALKHPDGPGFVLARSGTFKRKNDGVDVPYTHYLQKHQVWCNLCTGNVAEAEVFALKTSAQRMSRKYGFHGEPVAVIKQDEPPISA